MRNSDSSMVREAFTDNAIMQTVTQNRNREAAVQNGCPEGFLMAVGSPKDEIWDERIGGYEILVDDNLAHAWIPYKFYLGDSFSHCGVNSFQLIRKEEGWKIFFIVDTRRSDNCAGNFE